MENAYKNKISSSNDLGKGISTSRLVINEDEFPNWNLDSVTKTLGWLYISSKGTIEKEGYELLQIDFADP